MSKTYLFYATKDDLLAVTNEVEAAGAIKYIRFGNFAELPENFTSATQIPSLGIASHSSAVACDKFLIYEGQTTINFRKLKTGSDSKNKYAIDQLLNPDTIILTSGGLWSDDILLFGSISTASHSKSSQLLEKRYRDVLKKRFIKVQAFYVGPQALILLKNGKRLTLSAQSPSKFDLSLS